jgi:sugar O-acyltransferase (sialic acid O-acetyltransferase NeuD family)
MQKIVIIGGKGTAVNIADQIVEAGSRYGANVEFLGWAIDDESLGDTIQGYPVLCKTGELKVRFSQKDVFFLFALYKPAVMKERAALLSGYGIPPDRFATFVHPMATVSSSARLGKGNAILSSATVHAHVRLGNFNIVNSNVVIEHNTVLGNSNFISASSCIGSYVTVGNGVFVGLNATIREDVTVGDYAFIGMASNVLKPVEPESMVYGNPARVRR